MFTHIHAKTAGSSACKKIGLFYKNNEDFKIENSLTKTNALGTVLASVALLAEEGLLVLAAVG